MLLFAASSLVRSLEWKTRESVHPPNEHFGAFLPNTAEQETDSSMIK